jgi:hypothetical protein
MKLKDEQVEKSAYNEKIEEYVRKLQLDNDFLNKTIEINKMETIVM